MNAKQIFIFGVYSICIAILFFFTGFFTNATITGRKNTSTNAINTEEIKNLRTENERLESAIGGIKSGLETITTGLGRIGSTIQSSKSTAQRNLAIFNELEKLIREIINLQRTIDTTKSEITEGNKN